jgi:hypothetical protein
MWWTRRTTQHMHDPTLYCEVEAVSIYMGGISHTCLDRQFTDWWRLRGSEKKKQIKSFLKYSASPGFLVRAVFKHPRFILWKYQTFHAILQKWHVRRDRIIFCYLIHFKESDGFHSRLLTSFYSFNPNLYDFYQFSSLVLTHAGLCAISGFRREVDGIWALLGYYAVSSGNFLLT